MGEVHLEACGLKKTFNRRTIFFDISFRLTMHDGLGVTGRNGSGKSTLLKIIAGILSPTSGEIELRNNGNKVDNFSYHENVGFVAPYLQLYEEFSAWENLNIFRKIRGRNISHDYLNNLLNRVSLLDWKNHLVRTYSSGMKQRLKYACALLHEPSVLLLDEPATNLDAEGVQMVHDLMKEQIEKGILVVAANGTQDLLFCNHTVDLNIFGSWRGNAKA